MYLKKTVLALGLASALALGSYAAFEKSKTYTDGLFTDVPASEWYAAEVKSTYELGLMNGTGGGIFAPEGNVTVAEAITMASRASAINAGETIPTTDGEWYQMYINYAISKGFVKEGQFDSYDRPAKRHEVASLFENAMPDGYFVPKNSVNGIPDVSSSAPYYGDLLNLYNAGVVMGSDAYGTFNPNANITRAEAAAIITRVAIPEKRLAKTLLTYANDDAYILNITEDIRAGGASGIKSGWLYDNRGGTLAADYRINLSTLIDDSETEGIALIREFNLIESGKIAFEAQLNAIIPEGIYFELCNNEGNAIYHLEIKDGAWQTLNGDGSFTKLSDTSEGLNTFYVTVDLRAGTAVTTLRGKANATDVSSKLLGSNINLLTMKFATTDEDKPKFVFGSCYAYANYAVFDCFNYENDGDAPLGWTVNNAVIEGGELVLSENSTASKKFAPVSGKVIADMVMFVNGNTKNSFSLLSGDTAVATVEADGKSFYVNGSKVYDYYEGGLWYSPRLELDTDTDTLLFKLNGKEKASVPLLTPTDSIDGVVIGGKSAEKSKLDNLKIYKVYEYSDYVPEPVKPKGEEKYTVGLNICSLWTEGTHAGWKCITPYERPVLGYYDESIPETADWEIKYMVEHGIDFQAFCWYSPTTKTYLKHELTNHILDGYFNAKYSDMMNFALLLECKASIGKLDVWKKYHVPYLIEYYFKDDRYMTIDNKAVVCTFSLGSWANYQNLETVDNLAEALGYLEQEVMKLGFDGILYVGCTNDLSDEDQQKVGLDGVYYYNFGQNGARLDMTKKLNEWQTGQQKAHVVPTISVGFNNIGWGGPRSPLMTVKEYYEANKWARDEFLPKYAEAGTWEENFVMLSTWNEYGEGTYIMPSENNGGFGYLDALREVYTDEKADESLNTIPTEAQLKRINRMYPQYRQDLKNNQTEDMTAKKQIIAAVYANSGAKIGIGHMKDATVRDDGVLYATISGNDPRFMFEDFGGVTIPAEQVKTVRVSVRAPEGSIVELYFRTSEDGTYGQDKWLTARASSDGLANIDFNTDHAKWKGNITGIYVDPIQAAKEDQIGLEVAIEKIELLSDKDEGVTKNITINGLTAEANMQPVLGAGGEMLMPFDLDFGFEYKLDTFVNWDNVTKTLKIMGEKNEISFTVGSRKCVVDGKEVDLGYEIETLNGYPLVPIRLICETLGYKYSFDDEKGICIDMPGLEGLYDGIVPMQWEFNIPGYLAGWTSYGSNLTINPEGYLEITTESSDPVLQLSLDEPVPAINYSKCEIKVRFEGKPAKDRIQVFFSTKNEGGWSESRVLNFYPQMESTGGEWWTWAYDLKSNTAWDGIITGIRFDPFNAPGKFEVDYIRFYEKTEEEIEADKIKFEEEKKARLAQEAITDQQDDGKSLVWNFNTVGDVGGWVSEDIKNTSGEYLSYVTQKKDPIMMMNFEEPIEAAKYTKFKVRAAFDLEPPTSGLEVFWITEEDQKWDQQKRLIISHNLITTLGEYWTGEYDLSKHPLWKGKIKAIRFDPFNSPGIMNIDYIKLQGR